MADILSFKPKVPKPVPVRRIEGAAKCINCKREWQAIVEEEPGEEFEGWLECPSCSLMRGRFHYTHKVPIGTGMWTCNCGNDLFHVTETGHLCPNCGKTQGFG